MDASKNAENRVVRLSLASARKLKRLAADEDISISRAFDRYFAPELDGLLRRSEPAARGPSSEK